MTSIHLTKKSIYPIMNKQLLITLISTLILIISGCSDKKGDEGRSSKKGTIVEAEEADKPQAEDFILSSTDKEGQQLLWHVHHDGDEVNADVFDEDGFWRYSQEGTYNGTRLLMKGHSLIESIITLDVTRTGDRFRGKLTIVDEGETDKEGIDLKIKQAATPCKGHDINFEIIRCNYMSEFKMVYRPNPGKYARLDLDGDSIAETLWVRNGNGVESGAFFTFDPRSGRTAFVTPENQHTKAFFQGNVINATEEGVEGSSIQNYYVIENNRVARVIEVIREYNGMTGEMDTSYKDLTLGKTLTESEYNSFVDTLVPEDITFHPSWMPFPAMN